MSKLTLARAPSRAPYSFSRAHIRSSCDTVVTLPQDSHTHSAWRPCCGLVHRETTDAAQRQPPDAASAEAQLFSSLVALYPPLATRRGTATARAGVRAMPPRTSDGALPLAGRAHCTAGHRHVWYVTGLGARGLLYHAIVASWLVDAACDPNTAALQLLPIELQRCGFGDLVTQRLGKWLASGGMPRAAPELEDEAEPPEIE